MRLIIRNDALAASSYVADYIVDRIRAFNPSPENPFVLGLPTGSSPQGVYHILVDKYKAGEVRRSSGPGPPPPPRLTRRARSPSKMSSPSTWTGTSESPRDHPESYHSFMWKHFFSHVNIYPSNVHILDGNAPNLEAECVAYENDIKAAGGIDLFLAGIGEDGHVAFNEPGSSLASRTRVKTLAYDTILANSGFFDGDVDKVPRMALTVGVQTVLEAREVVVIILGQRKSLALQRCIEQGVNHMWTLSSLQLHPHPMIVVDEDATLELQVKTVKVSCRPRRPRARLLLTPPPSVLQEHRKGCPRGRLRADSTLQGPHRQRLRPQDKRRPSRFSHHSLPSPPPRVCLAPLRPPSIPFAPCRPTSFLTAWPRVSPSPGSAPG